ncbi:hypothetical protein V8B97DRAFT_2024630 [Scleroderma yunnanense]
MEVTMAVMQSAKEAVRVKPVKPKLRVRQGRPTSINTAPHVDDSDSTTEMEVDTYPAPNNLTSFSNPKDKPSSDGISARSNIHALKRYSAMAMLDNVAVEDQQSTYVQQQPEVLFHQLCMLFGLLIMLLLTESTLYWLNHIWTPIPSNKRALLLGCINSWTNEVKVNDSDGTPPNTLTSNSLTTSGVAAAGKVTLMYDEDKGNA